MTPKGASGSFLIYNYINSELLYSCFLVEINDSNISFRLPNDSPQISTSLADPVQPIMDERRTFSSSASSWSTSAGEGINLSYASSEDLPSLATRLREPTPKDYWFGSKYFECVLANDLVRHTNTEETASGIDVGPFQPPSVI